MRRPAHPVYIDFFSGGTDLAHQLGSFLQDILLRADSEIDTAGWDNRKRSLF